MVVVTVLPFGKLSVAVIVTTPKVTIRTPKVNDKFVALAESLRKTGNVHHVCGVKGRSAFASLVDGLPLAAGIDYMHCILQGVYKDVLEHQVRNLSKSQKQRLNEIIDNLHAPRETTCHSRISRTYNFSKPMKFLIICSMLDQLFL